MSVVLFTTYGWYQKTIVKRYSLPRYLVVNIMDLQEYVLGIILSSLSIYLDQ